MGTKFSLQNYPKKNIWAMKNLGGGNFQIFFGIFQPENWGRWTQFDEHIFEMGWFNHQPEKKTKTPLVV